MQPGLTLEPLYQLQSKAVKIVIEAVYKILQYHGQITKKCNIGKKPVLNMLFAKKLY